MGTSNNLQQRLDAYVAGACGPQALSEELLAHCAAAPRATWEVLALLDQYHRRGKLPQGLHRSISQSIERRALGVYANEQSGPRPQAAHAQAPAALPSASVQAGANHPAVLRLATAPARHAAPAPLPAAHASSSEPSGLASELLLLRKELQSTRAVAAAYLEQLKSHAWQRPEIESAPHPRPALVLARAAPPRLRPAVRWPTRSVQVVSVIVFMLAVGASQGLGERESAPRPRLARAAPVRLAVPGQLSLAADTFIVQPGGRSASITVARAGGTDGEISFLWWTQSAGARAGTDFRAHTAERVAMAAGTNALQLSVPILSNPARRHTELFYVAIGKPQGGATLGDTRRAAVFIMRP